MKLGDKIRVHRKAKGLTQTELGEMLGVKVNAVSKWECGRVEDIPTSKIKALANIFEVPPSYLIDDEKDLFEKAKNNIDKFKNINEPTKFIIECGLDDTRLNMSQELYKCMSELGYDVSLKISAGNHNWEYWNKCIQNTINTILADF